MARHMKQCAVTKVRVLERRIDGELTEEENVEHRFSQAEAVNLSRNPRDEVQNDLINEVLTKMICISHGFPGEMEFSPTSSPYPAQSRVAARAGFGDEWEKTPSLLENHVKCIFSHAASLILPKQTDFQQQQTDSSCHFEYTGANQERWKYLQPVHIIANTA